jgi:hypothetical protein
LRSRLLAPLVAALLVVSTGLPAVAGPTADGAARSEARGGEPRADAVQRAVRVRDAARTLVVTDRADAESLRRHHLVERVEHDPVLGRHVVTTSSPAALARDLRAQRLDAEPVVVVQAAADALAPAPSDPSDPFYRHHWGASVSALPYAFATATLPQQGPIIAILDTGVAPHAELGNRLLPGADLIQPGGDARYDPNGHGTKSALTAAAAANDGRGSVGSCPRCRILPIRVLAADGNGTSTTIAQGIRTAVDLGADIINISAGGTRNGGSFSYEDSAVAYATAAGVPIFASAGNQGVDDPNFPAAMSGVIGVAGSTESGARASQSNFGSWVDVAAPWCAVVGDPQGASNYCGTSASAPFAAGLVGLRRATVGVESVATVRARLADASQPTTPPSTGSPSSRSPAAATPTATATARPRP